MMILSGAAIFEERELDGPWTANTIGAGQFFLTTSPTPYELRWKSTSDEPLQVCHVYISLPVFSRAAKEVTGEDTDIPCLREVSGERDPTISAFVEILRAELLATNPPSTLYINGIAQSLAVHLIRNYPNPQGVERVRRGSLPAYKLRRITNLLAASLEETFDLATLAEVAGMSEFHFSRVFKKTTGLSPSQYFIRMRMDHASRLLRETDKSILEIGLEVGYSSPSHFAQIFRRDRGVTPSYYRGRD